MTSPKLPSPFGFSVAKAYEFVDSGSDQSDEPASDSDEWSWMDRQFHKEVDLSPKLPHENCRLETSKEKALQIALDTKTETFNDVRSSVPRPMVLQHTSPASAPQVPSRSACQDKATAKRKTSRSVSQGDFTLQSTRLNQGAHVLQAMGGSENTQPCASKRRRSDQDTILKANTKMRTPPRSRQILNNPRSLDYKSSSSSGSVSRSSTPDNTSGAHMLKAGICSGAEGHWTSPGSSGTAVESPLQPQNPAVSRRVLASDPLFSPFHLVSESIARVTHRVFQIMATALRDKIKSDDGYIYILRMAERSGFVKIGRTKGPVEHRQKEIQRCITYNLETIDKLDRWVPNYTRVERLIHAELWNHRRRFPCPGPCQGTKHKDDGDTSDSIVTHGEWFEISEDIAIKAVERWCNWMNTGPYSNYALLDRVHSKIDTYRKKPDRLDALIINGGKAWNWDAFLKDTYLQRSKLWLNKNFFQDRKMKSNCSTWDSLWKHWRSNVIFGLVFFLLSWFLSVLSDVLLSTIAFAPSLAVLNTLILGTGAILYAA